MGTRWYATEGLPFHLHLVQLQATHMAKILFKRTTPFSEVCSFIVADSYGEYERCDEESDFGLYFRQSDARVMMVSLCHYHTIYQESIWIGENSNES